MYVLLQTSDNIEKQTAAATKLLTLLLQLQVGMIDFNGRLVHYDTLCVVQFSKNKLTNSTRAVIQIWLLVLNFERFKAGKMINNINATRAVCRRWQWARTLLTL
jgi:hypothetical protein